MNHQAVVADFSFARPPDLSTPGEETITTQPSSMATLEMEEDTPSPPPSQLCNHNQAWADVMMNNFGSSNINPCVDAPPPPPQPVCHNQAWADAMNQAAAAPKLKGPLPIKAIGKKLGGALQKINNKVNIAKWIDDLEQDQHLADRLDRVNADNAEEEERKEICREATEACLKAMRDHLLEFLDDHPQATYEEWICNLHPENINGKLDGLTQTPMIDHRFYVQSSDHRILWNEFLNDLNDPLNLTPVRHYVEAKTFLKQPSITDDGATLTGEDPFAIITAQETCTSATQDTDLFEGFGEVQNNVQPEQIDLLGLTDENVNNNQSNQNQQQLQQHGKAVDLLSL